MKAEKREKGVSAVALRSRGRSVRDEAQSLTDNRSRRRLSSWLLCCSAHSSECPCALCANAREPTRTARSSRAAPFFEAAFYST
jgi:hypothetical protein